MLRIWNTLIRLLWPLLYLYRPFRGTLDQRRGSFELGAYDPRHAGLKVLVNAVSAGEVNAAAPFIRELRRLRPDARVVLLTTTRSGRQMAEMKLAGEVELVVYFPLADHPGIVRRYLERLRPNLYVTTESELWPNIQSQCRARGIRTALVNGRLYLHNKNAIRRPVVRRLLELLDLIVCQDERQRENYIRFGIAPERLAVSGNIKFDYTAPEWTAEQSEQWRARFAADAGTPIVVAGSTHSLEEALIIVTLDTLTEWLRTAGRPEPRLIVAPRHINRAADVADEVRCLGRQPTLLSEHQPGQAWDVLVVDAYGVLADLYRLADIVVMGGTFSEKVGGHNILEATALGKPVVVGEHVFSIAAQVEMLEQASGIMLSRGNLQTALAELLDDPQRAQAIGAAGQAATEANRGAATRAAELVLRLVGPR